MFRLHQRLYIHCAQKESSCTPILLHKLSSFVVVWEGHRTWDDAQLHMYTTEKVIVRENFFSGKMFAAINFRKKLVSIFRNSGSGPI